MIEPADLILIAVMNNPRDLEIARCLGWYRIPLRFAPKVLAVDYLALYQTGSFAEEKWSIRYAARIRGVELVRRVDLFQDEPDHPRAMEEYFRLQLGSLEALPHPIAAGRYKRLTFLYTTGERILCAASIGELMVRNEERKTLWRSMRDRQADLPADPEPSLEYWRNAIDFFLEWNEN